MLTLDQLAHLLNGVGHGNAQQAINTVSSLTRANTSDIAYFDNPLLRSELQATNAGIVLLKSEHRSWCSVNTLIVNDPLEAIKKVAKLLSPPVKQAEKIDATAQIHPTAQLGDGVIIGPYAVIESEVVLADGVVIGAHTIIESSVRIGKNTHIHAQVTIHRNSTIGAEVCINSGCVLGSTPFNFLKEHGSWKQGLTLGGVTVADQAHIGANTVIDRGSVGDTYLAKGVCIDNLVHIAHDVYIGANTAVAGCAIIGAHVVIGADCIIGGASCIAAYVKLTNDVVISGMSTVSKSLAKAGIYSSGTLVHEHQRWRKNAARFRRLDDYINKLSALERKVAGNEAE